MVKFLSALWDFIYAGGSIKCWILHRGYWYWYTAFDGGRRYVYCQKCGRVMKG